MDVHLSKLCALSPVNHPIFRYGAIFMEISCLIDNDKIDYNKVYAQLEDAWKQAGVKNSATEKYDWEKLMRAPDSNGY
jgi:hypothetical protein